MYSSFVDISKGLELLETKYAFIVQLKKKSTFLIHFADRYIGRHTLGKQIHGQKAFQQIYSRHT
jgi:hypothetical protein